MPGYALRDPAVTDAVLRSRAGIQDPNRPLGSFIFLGPTGVGKTERCRALAAALFDAEASRVRIDLQLRRLRERLAEQRIALELDGAARAFLVERGYDPAYGARPLKRAITRYLETPLAREIIAGQIPDGSTVDVAVEDDRLTFTPVVEYLRSQ